uniref:Uncharacterized protein n=1 Tax=Anguilla anguilla TaxID=7936 RepID=A0A0E9P843_ANGAN
MFFFKQCFSIILQLVQCVTGSTALDRELNSCKSITLCV